MVLSPNTSKRGSYGKECEGTGCWVLGAGYWVLCALVIAGCGGTSTTSATGGDDTDDAGDTDTTIHTLLAPDVTAIRTLIAETNANGLVRGLALGAITLPPCTQEDETAVDFEVTYTLTGVPDWLTFDATTRALALADGATVIPAESETAAEVTYTCTDSADATITASSDPFAINDLDGGGVTDSLEYRWSQVPMVNPTIGWIDLNPVTALLHPSVPTGITIVASGFDPIDAADDTADFDGDGVTNLAEIEAGTNLFVAPTDGTLGATEEYATSNTSSGIIAADFNGDGNLDLAVANEGAEGNDARVSVFTGAGDGTFGDRADFGAGNKCQVIAAGDFDGDGNIDLAATDNGDVVSIFLGVGDGTFGSNEDLTTETAPQGITTGDFDGDGDLDLAVASSGPDESFDGTNFSIFLGNGDGTFAERVNYTIGTGPMGMVSADLDADGNLDLITTNIGSNDISVALGAGDGTFGEGTEYATGSAPVSGGIGDFNEDGILDLVAANLFGGSFSILLGVGDGTFGAKTDISLAAGATPIHSNVSDLNGDGHLDLAVSDAGDGHDYISVFLGVGDGTFGSEVTYVTGNAPRKIAMGDFDNDGDLDLANANGGGANGLSVLLNP